MSNKKITAIIMAIAFVFALTSNAESVSAKTGLSASQKTIYVGKTAKIKISGAKKVKWSVTNSHIRVLKGTKKYAKVKGMSTGKAYLKAKVGKKTYKCKFTVKNTLSTSNGSSSNSSTSSGSSSNSSSNGNTGSTDTKKDTFSESDVKKSVEIEELVVNGEVISVIKSSYSTPIDISAKCTFYDSQGNPVDIASDSMLYVEKGHKCFMSFSEPEVSYSKFNIEYSYSDGSRDYMKSVIGGLSLSSNIVSTEYDNYIMVELTNSNNISVSTAWIGIFYYDKNDNLLATRETYFDDLGAGKSDTTKVYAPYDSTTEEDISYDHYEVFVNYAYHWDD